MDRNCQIVGGFSPHRELQLSWTLHSLTEETLFYHAISYRCCPIFPCFFRENRTNIVNLETIFALLWISCFLKSGYRLPKFCTSLAMRLSFVPHKFLVEVEQFLDSTCVEKNWMKFKLISTTLTTTDLLKIVCFRKYGSKLPQFWTSFKIGLFYYLSQFICGSTTLRCVFLWKQLWSWALLEHFENFCESQIFHFGILLINLL